MDGGLQRYLYHVGIPFYFDAVINYRIMKSNVGIRKVASFATVFPLRQFYDTARCVT